MSDLEKPALVASYNFPKSALQHTAVDNKDSFDRHDPNANRAADDDASSTDNQVVLSSVEEKKLLNCIDLRLLPLLVLMYVVKTIDAQNVSSRRRDASQITSTC